MDVKARLHPIKRRLLEVPMRLPAMRNRRVQNMIARPGELCIETTSVCNADCIMCPRKSMRRKMEKMPAHLYSKVTREAAEWGIPLISLQHYGDPMAMSDEDLDFYLREARQCAQVHLSTNGHLMTESKIDIILRNRVDLVQVDLDGADAETYEQIRVGCKYETVAENLRKLVSLRNEKGLKRPRVLLGIIMMPVSVMPDHWRQVEVIKDQWKDIVDDFAVSGTYNRGGSLVTLKHMNLPGQSGSSPCLLPWSQMVIGSDGNLALCCNDWDASYPLGNIETHTLKEMWHGESLRRVRQAMIGDGGDLPQVCKDCDYWEARNPRLVEVAHHLHRRIDAPTFGPATNSWIPAYRYRSELR
jgi:radical SAM protein with 4Fe4S-binding SPASM domain